MFQIRVVLSPDAVAKICGLARQILIARISCMVGSLHAMTSSGLNRMTHLAVSDICLDHALGDGVDDVYHSVLPSADDERMASEQVECPVGAEYGLMLAVERPPRVHKSQSAASRSSGDSRLPETRASIAARTACRPYTARPRSTMRQPTAHIPPLIVQACARCWEPVTHPGSR